MFNIERCEIIYLENILNEYTPEWNDIQWAEEWVISGYTTPMGDDAPCLVYPAGQLAEMIEEMAPCGFYEGTVGTLRRIPNQYPVFVSH